METGKEKALTTSKPMWPHHGIGNAAISVKYRVQGDPSGRGQPFVDFKLGIAFKYKKSFDLFCNQMGRPVQMT